MDTKSFKARRKHKKKQYKPRSKFKSGDTVSWIPDSDACKVLEITDKADCGIQILKIKSLATGTEFYVHEDVLYFRKQ